MWTGASGPNTCSSPTTGSTKWEPTVATTADAKSKLPLKAAAGSFTTSVAKDDTSRTTGSGPKNPDKDVYMNGAIVAMIAITAVFCTAFTATWAWAYHHDASYREPRNTETRRTPQ